ncbi:CocE/NonD family hydrolase [Amycolatopsis pithecellobii]|uniref:CocE/NonD family hydrolase n=1 Tax=Amycolatopsis pithecellobii TaxID=664692 RepID=A0A6N7Z219_9PSEU|nr:CocE/NonD family hydrolase [Amycolatopsis pithecellobii]MTD53850.1 CocE/NonD family hydrolase [Amycolatopsis pithecellobii]
MADDEGPHVERDVKVMVRDGATIFADVFRPRGAGPWPVLATMSPYGKDVFWPDRYPMYDTVEQGPNMVWETPNPDWWVARGYAVVRADSRGTGKSPGHFDAFGRIEQEDYFDVIEWAGTQEWSNGKVGLLGISYYAILQWLVAALQPPHLAAMVPWEGASDIYREWSRHGGILSGFTPDWWQRQILTNLHRGDDSGARFTDLYRELRSRPLADDWYAERTADLSRVTVPFLSAGNWGGTALHLRGNIEGFTHAASEHKWLHMHVGTHIAPFYTDEAKARQLKFLDYWLKGEDNGLLDEPPVRLVIGRGTGKNVRFENEWPLARTRWTAAALDATTKSLAPDTTPAPGQVTLGSPEGAVTFELAVPEALELTGPMTLRLWLSTTASDVDIFVTLRQFGPDGHELHGIGGWGQPQPMSQGWLRASQRKLSPELSTPERPFHPHDEVLPVPAGEAFAMDIEVWPTSISLQAGDKLTLEVASDDRSGLEAFRHNDPTDRPTERFSGELTIHTGGPHDSYLLLPVIPEDHTEN